MEQDHICLWSWGLKIPTWSKETVKIVAHDDVMMIWPVDALHCACAACTEEAGASYEHYAFFSRPLSATHVCYHIRIAQRDPDQASGQGRFLS